ncbi:MAG TPA: hypothetical protein VNK03_00705 [Gammaproteobacteria bacterium]|nr:hypothetical protein [Gammaproteobacteria bacterium]
MFSNDEEESKTLEEQARLEQLRKAIIARRLREKEENLQQETHLAWMQSGNIQQPKPKKEKKRKTKKKMSCAML